MKLRQWCGGAFGGTAGASDEFKRFRELHDAARGHVRRGAFELVRGSRQRLRFARVNRAVDVLQKPRVVFDEEVYDIGQKLIVAAGMRWRWGLLLVEDERSVEIHGLGVSPAS